MLALYSHMLSGFFSPYLAYKAKVPREHFVHEQKIHIPPRANMFHIRARRIMYYFVLVQIIRPPESKFRPKMTSSQVG